MSRGAPTILALDCSAASCSAALWRDGAIAAHRFEAMARGQAEALMPLVEAVMRAAEARYAELDLVAVTVGPGSFTGLRIGLAAARGIALAAGVPALGITSFAAVAAAVRADASDRDLAVAIDDRRGGVYWQEFDSAGRPIGEPRAVGPDQLAALSAARPPQSRVLVVGDGAALVEQAFAGASGLTQFAFGVERNPPDAAQLARLAAGLAADRLAGRDSGLPPVPIYLRAAEARLPEAAR